MTFNKAMSIPAIALFTRRGVFGQTLQAPATAMVQPAAAPPAGPSDVGTARRGDRRSRFVRRLGDHRHPEGRRGQQPAAYDARPVTAAAIHEHARRGGFPADAVNRVMPITDPKTGEAA